MCEEIRVNSKVVILHGNVIGCPNWKYADVWVKIDGNIFNSDFATVTYLGRQMYGKLTTLRSKCKLPVGPARSAAVHNHYARLERINKRLLDRHGVVSSLAA